MKCPFTVLVVIFAGACILACSPCRADDDYRKAYRRPVITLQGGIIAPAGPQTSIRMDLMEIKILSKRDRYELDAVFHLFNTGKATTEWVGFPKHGLLLEGLDRTVANPVVRDFISFDGWVDGQKADFAEKRSFLRDGSDPFPGFDHLDYQHPIGETRWMTRQITLPEQAATTVRIKLEAPYEYPLWRYSLIRKTACFYFGSGQYWEGKIGRAIIMFENAVTEGFQPRIVFECLGKPQIHDALATKASCELREVTCVRQALVKFGNYGGGP